MAKKIYVNLFNEHLVDEPNSEKHGVYIIHAIHPDGTGQTLNRIATQDAEGILYIGKASDQTLFERICDFKKVIIPKYKSTNHSGGRSYNASEALKAMIKPEQMGVEFLPVKNIDPKKAETEDLHRYRNMYGELPPLNSQG